jgi:hypothetical protein
VVDYVAPDVYPYVDFPDTDHALVSADFNKIVESLVDIAGATGRLKLLEYGTTVAITTLGATFNPTVELASGSTATVYWLLPNGDSVTGISPTISFGSTGTRVVRMAVMDGGRNALDQVVTFNLGFNNTDDSGLYSIGTQYNKTAQSVSKVEGIRHMTGLLRFCAANIPTLVGTLDFTGLSQLQFVECFASNVQNVITTGCDSLIRLCMENNNQSTANLNPVSANLYDFRCAIQKGGSLTFTSLQSRMPNLYHFCIRDQAVTNMPDFTMLPAVRELWTWNTGQTGQLRTASSALLSLNASSNGYTSADLTNQFPAGRNGSIDLHSNQLTAVTLTGCPGLTGIDLHINPLNQSAVDTILTTVDAFNTSGGTLNLSSTSVPSSGGITHVTALRGRGWTVTVDGGGGGGGKTFTRVAGGITRGSVGTPTAPVSIGAVTSGNLLVAIIEAPSTPTISDNAGNTWTRVGPFGNFFYLAYCLNSGANGALTVSASVSGDFVRQLAVDRFTVTGGLATIGGTAGADAGTLGLDFSTDFNLGNLGTVPAGALVWGGFAADSASGDQNYTAGFQTGTSGTANVIGVQTAGGLGTGFTAYILSATGGNAAMTWHGSGGGFGGTGVSAYFT